MGPYLAVAPLLLLALGGCGLMLAEAYSTYQKTREEGPSSQLALPSAVTMLAAAVMAFGLWLKDPATIEGVKSLEPWLVVDKFTVFFTMVASAVLVTLASRRRGLRIAPTAS